MRLLLISGLVFGMGRASFAQESDVASVSRRVLSELRSTHYTHDLFIDEVHHRYDVDCSGFAKEIVDKANRPAAEELELVMPSDERPLARDFVRVFDDPGDAWQRIRYVRNLRPGDLIAWLIPEGDNSGNTGHVMIVNGRPRPSPRFQNELLVPVIDSTSSGHGKADPRRKAGPNGVGAGVIGLVVDNKGRPTAYYWSGGESVWAEETKIRMGRIP